MLGHLLTCAVCATTMCLLLFFTLPLQACAEEQIDMNQDISLQFSLQNEKTPVQGAKLHLYKVADVDGSCKITCTKKFAGYENSVSSAAHGKAAAANANAQNGAAANADAQSANAAAHGNANADAQSSEATGSKNADSKAQDGWSELAGVLGNLVVMEEIGEDISLTTDERGAAACKGLKAALYLVTADSVVMGEELFQVTPFLVFLPGKNTSGNWLYSVAVTPKYVTSKTQSQPPQTPSPPTPQPTPNPTPQQPVQQEDIYDDPPVYKKVKGVVPEKKGRFEFCMKAEKNTAGIAVKSMPMPSGSKNGIKTVVVKGAGSQEFGILHFTKPGWYIYRVWEQNTGEKGYTYDRTVYFVMYEVTLQNGKMAVQRSFCDGDYKTAGKMVFTNQYRPAGGKLPQTGQLWWPVPVLLLMGCLLVFLGLLQNRRSS